MQEKGANLAFALPQPGAISRSEQEEEVAAAAYPGTESAMINLARFYIYAGNHLHGDQKRRGAGAVALWNRGKGRRKNNRGESRKEKDSTAPGKAILMGRPAVRSERKGKHNKDGNEEEENVKAALFRKGDGDHAIHMPQLRTGNDHHSAQMRMVDKEEGEGANGLDGNGGEIPKRERGGKRRMAGHLVYPARTVGHVSANHRSHTALAFRVMGSFSLTSTFYSNLLASFQRQNSGSSPEPKAQQRRPSPFSSSSFQKKAGEKTLPLPSQEGLELFSSPLPPSTQNWLSEFARNPLPDRRGAGGGGGKQEGEGEVGSAVESEEWEKGTRSVSSLRSGSRMGERESMLFSSLIFAGLQEQQERVQMMSDEKNGVPRSRGRGRDPHPSSEQKSEGGKRLEASTPGSQKFMKTTGAPIVLKCDNIHGAPSLYRTGSVDARRHPSKRVSVSFSPRDFPDHSRGEWEVVEEEPMKNIRRRLSVSSSSLSFQTPQGISELFSTANSLGRKSMDAGAGMPPRITTSLSPVVSHHPTVLEMNGGQQVPLQFTVPPSRRRHDEEVNQDEEDTRSSSSPPPSASNVLRREEGDVEIRGMAEPHRHQDPVDASACLLVPSSSGEEVKGGKTSDPASTPPSSFGVPSACVGSTFGPPSSKWRGGEGGGLSTGSAVELDSPTTARMHEEFLLTGISEGSGSCVSSSIIITNVDMQEGSSSKTVEEIKKGSDEEAEKEKNKKEKEEVNEKMDINPAEVKKSSCPLPDLEVPKFLTAKSPSPVVETQEMEETSANEETKGKNEDREEDGCEGSTNNNPSSSGGEHMEGEIEAASTSRYRSFKRKMIAGTSAAVCVMGMAFSLVASRAPKGGMEFF